MKNSGCVSVSQNESRYQISIYYSKSYHITMNVLIILNGILCMIIGLILLLIWNKEKKPIVFQIDKSDWENNLNFYLDSHNLNKNKIKDMIIEKIQNIHQ